ncbi:ABC transporter ATP-binding protein [Aurantimicrobium minutum]|uniref:ABC transporter ATP-binding protein n=1 Tax=Aurantimicrobium minutum TaxID=708131 RepID=UPI0024763FB6|nr:ATP-binding cassette domain-containing protein [Aurantimicrobium minutum]
MISNVTLEIKPGEITTVVGPNGAGKTSLLESISGVVGVSAGVIELDDHPLTKMSRRDRAKAGIAHVEQGRMIFPGLTVRENIQLTAKTKSSLDDALAWFPELGKRIDSQALLLSGGEQQMVVLARAFASKPRYLLLDEMSLGLAPVVFLRLLPIVQEIAKTGVGILLVEQFAHLALKIATDATVISNGHVTFHGPATQLLENEEQLKQAYLG